MKAFLTIVLLFVCLSVYSQSNAPVFIIDNNTHPVVVDYTTKIITDIITLITDVKAAFSFDNLLTTLVGVFFLARGIKKYTNFGNVGAIGNILSHIALDLNQKPNKPEEPKNSN